MKKISIIRHGKSSWKDGSLNDRKRPLRNKGIRRTNVIGNYIKSKNIAPDFILSSPAIRAFETAKIVQKILKIKESDFCTKEYLYVGDYFEIAFELSYTEDRINNLMIFGHNSALTDLSNFFLKKEEIDWLPTSALVHLNFNVTSWSEIMETKADLIYYMSPKKLDDK